MSEKSVAITGLGMASAIGSSVEEFWSNLLAGTSGFRMVENIRLPKRGCRIAAEVLTPPRKEIDSMNPVPRAVELALFAARQAWTDAEFNDKEIDRTRVGVVVGTGIGNQDLTEFAFEKLQSGERLSPLAAFRGFAHSAACEITCEFDLRGAVHTVTSGCNSGADAIGLALDWIRLGRCDAVLVGGTEAEINATFYGAMTAARALTTQFNANPEAASRPFDIERGGNAPGEGAGFLILESMEHARKRKAQVRAKLLGYSSCSAGTRPPYDPFNPIFDTAPMLRTMRTALKDAEITAQDVSFISANGSGSVFYDPLEAQALAELLGNGIKQAPVYSIKGALGQTGAVTPALQAIAAVLSIGNEMIPPTCNVDELDTKCSINLVRGKSINYPSKYVLANSIGFGGFYYSSLVFGRARSVG